MRPNLKSDRLAAQLRHCDRQVRGDSEPFVAFVYMIRAGEYIKIGVARDVEKRLQSMQTGCPFVIEVLHAWPCANPYRFERHLHWKLRAYRTRGEWFTVPQSVIDDILTTFNR